MPDRPSDEELHLVLRAKAGDREAFGLLYDRHLDAIYRYAFFRTRDGAEAEDVTSETFHRALEAMPRFEPRRPFLAFLYTVARNVTIDHLRRDRSRVDYEDALEHPSDAPSLEEHAVSMDEAGRVRDAIRTLTPLQQEIIVMRFIEGLSYAEVASVTGKPEATIRGIQRRALEALREIVPPEVRG